VGIGRYLTRDLAKEMDVRSKNFMSLFVMPATDIVEEDNDLVVTIDLPGFAKKDTKFLNLQAFQ
jgi:HSP20 family protein